MLTSSEFGQDASRAKRLAEGGPVFISTDGMVSHVFMTKAEFDRLTPSSGRRDAAPEKPAPGQSLADALAYDGEGGDFDWEPPRLGGPIF